MSLTRAFTTRRARPGADLRDAADGAFPQRSNTTKMAGSIRHKISAPVELVHTTNMLSYNAPDLFPKTASSTTSARSDDDSDTALTAASTPPTSPDSPFPEKRAISPEPNHLSCYFSAPAQALPPTAEVPAIPKRAPSHTKKSYDGLARQRSASHLSERSNRSISTKASFTFSRSSSTSTSTSTTSVSSDSHHAVKPATTPAVPPTPSVPPVSHKKDYSGPFGHELAQVSELAEEYAAKEKLSAVDEEEQELARKGLLKFSADDYLREIQGLVSSIFTDARPVAALWI